MAIYIYSHGAPLTSFTMGDGREVILRPGVPVDLPDCDVTETLKALGRLSEPHQMKGE
jgi:hypothetical protein